MEKNYNIKIKLRLGQKKPSVLEIIAIERAVSLYLEKEEEKKLKENKRKFWKYAFLEGRERFTAPFKRFWGRYKK